MTGLALSGVSPPLARLQNRGCLKSTGSVLKVAGRVVLCCVVLLSYSVVFFFLFFFRVAVYGNHANP